jgi:GT2 family glycosyltransferase
LRMRNLSERGSGCTSRPVAAIVVTYNRVDLLRRWLQDLKEQTRPVQEIIVVDNASEDGTEAVMLQEYPWVTYVRMSENVGPGGAWAAGIAVAYHHGHEWFWVFNDDSFPPATALEQMLSYDEQLADRVGMLCPVSDLGSYKICGIYWKGRAINYPQNESAGPWFVDGVTFAGPLISRKVVDSIGYPRSDFFFMFEEYEYCLRARHAGYQIAILPNVTVTHLAAGSNGFSPPWRGYYQSRNHLAMALERRSARDLLWWAVVQGKYCAGAILHLDCKFQRVKLRLMGAWDGLRGHLGKTIDPATFSYRGSRAIKTSETVSDSARNGPLEELE